MTVATGGEPAGHPLAHCSDRCPVRVVSVGPQPVQPHAEVFQNGYRTASGAVQNDGHYFCGTGGNRSDGLNEPVTKLRGKESGDESCHHIQKYV
ncbi:hypothetical protein FE572_23005 [Escherichia coli]|nr:hypothetical protein [Escherichia coli]EFD0614611.1 hypothetical protein [Escherichia coli]EFD0628768.1 hypothetical protein [Escherichia coli]EFD0642492.1 hypothetical protein [Escherichia coli]EFD0661599.1 hypothetical protein [Escherichia coli]